MDRVSWLPLLLIGLICTPGHAVWRGDGAPPALLTVVYTPRGVEFSGKVDSEETGQTLAAAVKAVRPDLPILNKGLEIDGTMDLPNINDLKSLLAEIGISTHEGGLAIWDDAILLTGLTDSVISQTALKIRLDPILGDRELIDRICIVSSADLPDLEIKLSSGETTGPLLDFEQYPTAAEQFTLPGISLAKLIPTLVMLSDLDRLSESAKEEAESEETLRAVPLFTNLSQNSSTAGPLRAVPAEPQPTRVHLESIRFSRNTVLLQANQEIVIETVVKQMKEPPLAGHPVLLKSVRTKGGSEAYSSYLAEQRGAKVREILTERGVSRGRLSLREEVIPSAVDEGEVKLIVEIPPPKPEPIDEEGRTVTLKAEEAEGGTDPKVNAANDFDGNE
ncbi:MAG: OmpA family protein [Verrucomicrobiota bacterium]